MSKLRVNSKQIFAHQFCLGNRNEKQIDQTMKRLKRSPETFEVINLLDTLSRKSNHPIRSDKCFDECATTIKQSQNSMTINVIHGLHAESMFEYVVAGLGSVDFIKKEDSGGISIRQGCQPIQLPDYSIVLITGERILVEVKNCHMIGDKREFKLLAEYRKKLRNYALLVGSELFYAVYWSKWRQWTLLRDSDFDTNSGIRISFLEAMKANEMSLLGDSIIATIPPIVYRIIANTKSPRSFKQNGECEFTIADVQIFSNGKQLLDKFERSFASKLAMFSKWVERRVEPTITNGDLEYVDFEFEPEENDHKTKFQSMGFLSHILSNHYISQTTDSNGEVERLTTFADPGEFQLIIPDGYEFTQLELWRFKLSKIAPKGSMQ